MRFPVSVFFATCPLSFTSVKFEFFAYSLWPVVLTQTSPLNTIQVFETGSHYVALTDLELAI